MNFYLIIYITLGTTNCSLLTFNAFFNYKMLSKLHSITLIDYNCINNSILLIKYC